LSAKPALVEPIFLAEIQTEHEVVSKIHTLLGRRRGFVIDEMPKEGTPLYLVKAHIPVLESFGFDADLREATSGRAIPQLLFSHWQVVDGDPNEEGTLANKIICQVRERKNLKGKIPSLEVYNDKL